MSAVIDDPRADAPTAPLVFFVSISPTVAPALERVLADIKRKNPHSSDEQNGQQFIFEAIVLMDARIRPRPHVQD